MKFEIGDAIVVNLTQEDGKVIDIINEKMVMIEVKGVRFPAYTDQIDFPYLKMFMAERKTALPKSKTYIDQVKTEKKKLETQAEEGVFVSFIPVFDKDIFDDDVVEKLKVYLINQTRRGYHFRYELRFSGEPGFSIENQLDPMHDFYLHDVPFDDLSDNPRFDFEFSLLKTEKGMAPYYEATVKLKGKQLFKKLEEIKHRNEPMFRQELFKSYPRQEAESDPVDLGRLGNAGFRVYDASQIRSLLPAARSVVDLHIEKLTDQWQQLKNAEMLDMQLKEFEKYFELAQLHHLPVFTVIHGLGSGRLRDEIHNRLRGRSSVKSFVNQYTPQFGYGATEIFLNL